MWTRPKIVIAALLLAGLVPVAAFADNPLLPKPYVRPIYPYKNLPGVTEPKMAATKNSSAARPRCAYADSTRASSITTCRVSVISANKTASSPKAPANRTISIGNITAPTDRLGHSSKITGKEIDPLRPAPERQRVLKRQSENEFHHFEYFPEAR
ncbi:hypothetical protein [Rhizobium sp. NXC24]|uniref:hypothetical protein n=1 Tax=Rhizobium sp. NXC24 TaxID=2048897 RepID=UPI001FE18EF3|nr:hypothetical protein [Rhizobium sp. NXC24]